MSTDLVKQVPFLFPPVVQASFSNFTISNIETEM